MKKKEKETKHIKADDIFKSVDKTVKSKQEEFEL